MARDITLNFKGNTQQLNAAIKSIVSEMNKVDTAGKQIGAGGGLFGSILGGNLAARGISEAISLTKQLAGEITDLGIASVKLAANFQQTTNALAVFTGSQRSARRELAELDALAAKTPGLRLQSAEEGYQKLRALGFQADITKKLVAGLANQKILSGKSNEDIERVIVNLTQIRASSKDAARDIKESIRNLPSLTDTFQKAFNTADPSKLRGILQKDPNGFFTKFADELANAEKAEGGLNDAFGKSQDALTQLGRAFGEPLLDPLTKNFKDLTSFIYENEAAFAKLGKTSADVVGVLSDAVRATAAFAKSNAGQNTATGARAFIAASSFGISELSFLARDKFLDYAKQQRQISEGGKLAPSGLVAKISGGVSDDTIKEQAAIRKAADADKKRELDAAKQQELTLLKDTAKESESILKNRYDREQSTTDLATRYTAQQEIVYSQQSAKNKAAYTDAAIARTTEFYNKQIALQAGNDGDIQKLTSERNQKIGDLETERFVDSAKSQKQVQDLERRIYEERRQAAIEFGNLQIREVEDSYDRQVFYIQRAISENIVSEKEGYEQEIQLAKANYTQTLALTKSQYEKQLENLSLTDEQRANILKEMYLTEQGLADKNARTILQIQDSIRANFIENLGIQRDALSSSLKDSASLVSSFYDNFFSPEAFSKARLNSFNELALQKTTQQNLKKDIGDSQAQGNVFRNLKTDLLKNNPSDTAADIGSNFNDEQLGQYNKFNELELNALKRAAQLKKQLKDVTDDIPDSYNKFADLANQINTKNVNAFDNLSAAILKSRQALDKADADSEVDYRNAVIAAGGLKGTELTKAKNDLAKANRAQERLGYEQAKESADQYADSIKGLTENLAALRSGEEQATAGVLYEAKQSFLKENISLVKENAALEQKYYQDAGYIADQYKNKRLQNERAVFELRQELAQKGNFDQNESDAKVLDYLNSQVKGLSETFADFRIGIAGTFFDAVTSPFDALSKKLENLNPIVRGLAQTFLDLGRDIVKAFSQKIIMQLLGLGGTGSGTSSGGGLFGGVINSLKNAFSIGGRGSTPGIGGTAGFNPNSFAPSVGGSVAHEAIHAGAGNSTGLSSIFGARGFGNNAGTYGALGAGASLLGGLIGGRAGGVISGAGSGALLGLSLGGPIGAAAGAIAGGLLSLFGGDPKRKADKKENLPKLNEGFIKAFADLNQILTDSDSLKFNPPEDANTKADAVYSDIASGFNIAFESKKYRAEAQKLIEQKKREADALRNQINLSVINAKTYGADAAALVPVFATGNYFGDNQMLDMQLAAQAQRPHGFISGGRLGVDRHLGLFADGETIINHIDRMNIIKGAGYDVFKEHARIPNYPKYADGNYFAAKGFTATTSQPTAAPQIVVQPQITIVVEGEIDAARIKDVLVDGLKDTGMQVKIARAAGDGNAYTRGAALRSKRG